MAIPQFKTSALPLVPQDVVSNMDLVMEYMSDLRKMTQALQTKFGDAKDLADQAGYPAKITEYTDELEKLREDTLQVQDECQNMMQDLSTKLDKFRQLATLPPATFPDIAEILEPSVKLCVLRLLPQVIKDEGSLLNVHPKFKELIEQDLDLQYRRGASMTQLAAESERMSELQAEVQDLTDKANGLQIDNRRQKVSLSLQSKNHITALNKLNDEHARAIADKDSQLGRAEDELDKLRKSKAEYKKGFTRYKQAHDDQSALSAKYLAQKEKFATALQAAKATIESQQEEIEQLTQRQEEYSLAKDDASAALKMLKETCIVLQNEKASLRKTTNKAMDTLRSEKDTEIAALQAELEQTQDQLHEQVLVLNAAKEDLEQLQRDKARLRRDLTSARDARNKQREACKKVKDELEDKNRIEAELQDEKQALQDDFEGEQRKVASLERSVQRGKQRVDKFLADQEHYRRNEQALQFQLQDGETEAHTTICTLKNQKIWLEDKLQNKQDECATVSMSYQEAIQRAEKINKNYQQALKELRTERGHVVLEMADYDERISSLEDTKRDLNGQINDLTRQNDSLLQDKENAEAKAEDAHRRWLEEQKASKQAASELETVRTNMTQETAAKDRLQAQHDKLSASANQDSQQIVKLANSLQNTGQELEDLRTSLKQQTEQHEKTLAAWQETHKAATAADQIWRDGLVQRLERDYREKSAQLKAQYDAQIVQANYGREIAQEAEKRLISSTTQLEKSLAEAQEAERTVTTHLTNERIRYRFQLEDMKDADTRKFLATRDFLSRVCRVGPEHLDRIGPLVDEVQNAQAYYLPRFYPIFSPAWNMLQTWGPDDGIIPREDGSVSAVSSEILFLQLLGAAYSERLTTRQCQWRLQRLMVAITSPTQLHVGLVKLMVTLFIQGIAPKLQQHFDIAITLWQFIAMIGRHWHITDRSRWLAEKARLEEAIRSHECGDIFNAIMHDQKDLILTCPGRSFGDNYLVLTQSSWEYAALVDQRDNSVRFFSKSRWYLGLDKVKVKAPKGQEDVYLPFATNEDYEWAQAWWTWE